MSKRARKPRAPRSLVTTLAAAFLGLSLASLIITYIPQLLLFIQARQEIVGDRQQYIAKEAANTVASFVQGKFGELEATVKAGEPTLASQEEQKHALGNLLGLDPAFRQLILFNLQDQELAKVSRISQTAAERILAQIDPDLFSQVRQGNRYVSPVYVDEATSEPMVIMAVAATDAFGDFQGTLLAEVNLKFMWDLVDRLQVGESGLAYVVDRQGNLLALGDISRVLRGENVSHLALIGEFIRNPAPVGEAASAQVQGINGISVIGTYVPLGMPDWAVVTELPLAEAQQQGIQNTVISGFAMLVIATLVGLVGFYLARRLAVPLLNLTTTAGRIADGETGLRAVPQGPSQVVNLAKAFNSMTAQLQELIGSLEQQVADRTRNLQVAAEVAHATTAVLDPDELLRQTVDLVRERLDLYYVGLFLLDEEGRFAVLRAGTGEAGRQMMTRGHRLEVGGASMIGQCVATGQSAITLDVGEGAVHFDNPLLPETRSEMALPLRAREQIIGAMTVQDTRPAAFDEADIAVLQTMADQVAMAIDNARLFAETQAALQEMRAIHQHYLGRAWAEYGRARVIRGYQQTGTGLVPLGDETLPEVRQAMAAQQPEKEEGYDDSDHRQEPSPSPDLVTLIRLRGQPIGALGFRQVDERRPWTDEEIEVVQAIAQEFALAADNLRLMEDTQRRAIQEQLTREIWANIRSAVSVQDAIQRATREMGRALGASEIVAHIGTERILLPESEGDGHE